MSRVDEVCKRADFLRELLAEFDARLSGFGPGVSAFLPGGGEKVGWGGENLDFNRTQWAWLEPLLVELRDRRKGVLK